MQNASHNLIVLIEPDESLSSGLKLFLEKTLQAQVEIFSSFSDSLNFFQEKRKFLLILNLNYQNLNNDLLFLETLSVKKHEFETVVTVNSDAAELGVQALRKGAKFYLTKPYLMNNLRILLLKLAPSSSFDFSHSTKDFPTTRLASFHGMIGNSPAMANVFEKINLIANSDSTVLIHGESGTGKELIAQAIHKLSSRRQKKIISLNCGAIPKDLLESELFGHIKGSFTGAIADKKGKIEQADQGSLFLDEIGDMPLQLQVKILRVLQNKEVDPVGGNQTRPVNVRIIAATHQKLLQLVKNGRFREDLYYRLNVIPLTIPPLRERMEDIPLLISHFVAKYSEAGGRHGIEFSDETKNLLYNYSWPGNIRELENLIERLVILKGGFVINPEDLPETILTFLPQRKNSFILPPEGLDLKQVLSQIEEDYILQALSRTKGNKQQASKLLQMNRTTLIEKMKKKKIEHQESDLIAQPS